MLEHLKSITHERILVRLNEDVIDDLGNLLYKLFDVFSYSPANPFYLRDLIDFIDSRVKPIIGIDRFVVDQEITAEINPLGKGFTLEEVEGHSEKSSFKGLLLSPYNIESFKVNLCQYGFDGELRCVFSYEEVDFPDAYSFLLENKDLSILLKIRYSYLYKDQDKKGERYSREFTLQGISILGDNGGITTDVSEPVYSYDSENKKSTLYSAKSFFNIRFQDPARAIWSQIFDTYLVKNKSISELITEQNSFNHFATFNLENCSDDLKLKQKQFFVCTNTKSQKRSFYDVVIEEMYKSGDYLEYDFEAFQEKGLACYNVYSDLSHLASESDQNKKAQSSFIPWLDTLSISSINCQKQRPVKKSIQIISTNYDCSKRASDMFSFPENYAEEHDALLSTCLVDSAKLEGENSSDFELKRLKEGFKRNASVCATYTVKFKNFPAYISFWPSYTPFSLEEDQWHDVIVKHSDSVIIKSQTICFRKNKQAISYVEEYTRGLVYVSEKSEDHYEKISKVPKTQSITHTCSVESQWIDGKSVLNSLPLFIPFKPFSITALVSNGTEAGDSESEISDRSYKFYVDKGEEEGSFSDLEASNGQYFNPENSDNIIFYALKLPEGLVVRKDSSEESSEGGDSNIAFAPVNISNKGGNNFDPYRNNDVVEVQVSNSRDLNIIRARSNSAIVKDKATELVAQERLLGTEQELKISYHTNEEDRTFEVSQIFTPSDEKSGYNEIIMSKDGGLSLRRIGKKGNSEE